METKDGKQAVRARTRSEWREWLSQNSQTEKSVWLIIYHKKSKVESASISDAMEEALCVGWIDSLAKKEGSRKLLPHLHPPQSQKQMEQDKPGPG